MIKDYVVRDYQEYIALNGHKYPSELIDGLKHNERVPGFVNSLIKEFHIMEHRQRIKLSRRKIKEIVYELTKSFLALLKRRGDEMAMSAAEQARLIAEANSKMAIRDDEAKELAKELAHDEVISTDDRDDVL